MEPDPRHPADRANQPHRQEGLRRPLPLQLLPDRSGQGPLQHPHRREDEGADDPQGHRRGRADLLDRRDAGGIGSLREDGREPR